MVKCSEAEELISLYIDEKLENYEKAQFEEHLRICDSCRKELEEMKALVEICNNMPEASLPDSFKIQLHEKLKLYNEKHLKQKKSMLLRNRYIRISGTIAAGLVLILLVKGYLGNSFFTLPQTASDSSVGLKQESAAQAPPMLMADKQKADGLDGAADTAVGINEFNTADASENYELENTNKSVSSVQRVQGNSLDENAIYESCQRYGYDIDRGISNKDIVVSSEDDPDVLTSRVNIVRQIAVDSGAEVLDYSPDSLSLTINLPDSQYNGFIDRLCQAVTEELVQINSMSDEYEKDIINSLNNQEKNTGAEMKAMSAVERDDISSPEEGQEKLFDILIHIEFKRSE